jgi:hypothetical protein
MLLTRRCRRNRFSVTCHETVEKSAMYFYPVIPGRAEPEPGTYEHRRVVILVNPECLGSGLAPSGQPGMT